MPVVLAHQGGWDEVLLVLGPLLVFAVLLLVAKRRAEQEAAAEAESGSLEPSEPPEPDDVVGDPPGSAG